MSYLSNTEESELKRLEALTDNGVLDDGEFRDAKSTILEVAKRRRLSAFTEPRAAAASTAAAAPTGVLVRGATHSHQRAQGEQ